MNNKIVTTVQFVANRIHTIIYGKDTEHKDVHSCPCRTLAEYYLGVTDKTGLFWPDKDGKNSHKV